LHYVSQLFYTFWQQNGSLDRLGFPISEEQTETDPATGKPLMAGWSAAHRYSSAFTWPSLQAVFKT
jgi:hypothetical protein